MKNTPTITMPKEQAKVFYEEYLNAVKTRKEKYVKELKQVYYHLSRGNKVLDIYEVFKKSGVNKQGEPKLAIARADSNRVEFTKGELGAGRFKGRTNAYDVDLPTSTFPKWKRNWSTDNWQNKKRLQIVRPEISTKVPIVPAHLLPEGELDNYFVLWEVSSWEPMPVYKDPFLLKRINANAFVVLAEWDLTPVEQAIIRGH